MCLYTYCTDVLESSIIIAYLKMTWLDFVDIKQNNVIRCTWITVCNFKINVITTDTTHALEISELLYAAFFQPWRARDVKNEKRTLVIGNEKRFFFQIQVSFLNFNLEKPNECDINYVQLYNKEPTMEHNPKLINNFCGSIAELVTSDGNEAYLRFFVTKAAINSSFEALMTATRERGKEKSNISMPIVNFIFQFQIYLSQNYFFKGCEDDEFDCQDVCIAGKLTCNDRFNCRYRFDEDAEICKVSMFRLGKCHFISNN